MLELKSQSEAALLSSPRPLIVQLLIFTMRILLPCRLSWLAPHQILFQAVAIKVPPLSHLRYRLQSHFGVPERLPWQTSHQVQEPLALFGPDPANP